MRLRPMVLDSDLVRSCTSRPLRVLVVDDSKDTVASLAMLRLAGHEFATAASGPARLQAALADTPDVVLLDLGLPGIDGYEVARRLREKTAKPVLIAMTGYGQAEDRERSRDAGFDYHLVKPVDPAKLQQLLTVLGRSGPGSRG